MSIIVAIVAQGTMGAGVGKRLHESGAAVRTLHDQCKASLARYVRLTPVIDAVEGTQTSVANIAAADKPSLVKFIGNVPAQTPKGGTLRHKGWRAEKVELPKPKHGAAVIAPAEIEIE